MLSLKIPKPDPLPLPPPILFRTQLIKYGGVRRLGVMSPELSPLDSLSPGH